MRFANVGGDTRLTSVEGVKPHRLKVTKDEAENDEVNTNAMVAESTSWPNGSTMSQAGSEIVQPMT